MLFYENGNIRIHYQEVGSGFPLMVIPGGGLNSTVTGLANHPFNPMEEFKDSRRVWQADRRRNSAARDTGNSFGFAARRWTIRAYSRSIA